MCFKLFFVDHLISTRVHDLEMQGLYSNPIQFHDFLQESQDRVMLEAYNPLIPSKIVPK